MRKFYSSRLLLLVVALVPMFLAACGPTDEERLLRVSDYMESAEYGPAIVELSNVLQSQPQNVEARVLLAECSFKTGEYETAVQQYARAFELGVRDESTALGYGRVLVESGDPESLSELLVSGGMSLPEDERGHALLGDMYLALGQWDKAETHYGTAIEMAGDFARAEVGMAMVAAARNQLGSALKRIESASGAHPESSFVRLKLGDLYREMGKHEAAIMAYSHSIQLWESHEPRAQKFAAYYHLISSMIETEEYEDALASLERFQVEFPGNPVRGFLSGRIAFERGEYEVAQLELQSYLSSNESDGRGKAMLGAISLAQENLRQAEIYLFEAVRAQAGGLEARQLLAETRLRLERPEDALAVLQGLDVLTQEDPRQQAMLGRAQIALGALDQAIEHFERSLEKAPDDQAVALALASAYVQSKRHQDAIALLESIPADPRTRLRKEILVIAAFASSGNQDLALQKAQVLTEQMADEPSAHVVAGALQELLGNEQAAVEAFESALAVDPENAGALISLGRIHARDGDLGKARKYVERLVDIRPGFEPGMQLLAEVFRDDPGQLQSLLADLVSRYPDESLPKIALASLYTDRGSPEAALGLLNPLVADGSPSAAVHHQRALALRQSKQLSAAIQSGRKAVTLVPTIAEYQYTLAQLSLEAASYESAIAAARAYHRLSPDDANGVFLLIRIAREFGKPADIWQLVEKFLARHDGSPEADTVRGEMALARGDVDTALIGFGSALNEQPSWDNVLRLARAHRLAATGGEIGVVEDWLSGNPEDVNARLFYAQLLQEHGDSQASRVNYELLLEDDALGLAGLNNLAWLYFADGDSRAVELAGRAYELAPGSAAVMDTYGWILLHEGKADAGLPLLTRAASLLPDNHDVAYHLAYALFQTGDTESAARILERILQAGESFESRPDAEVLSADIGS